MWKTRSEPLIMLMLPGLLPSLGVCNILSTHTGAHAYTAYTQTDDWVLKLQF